MSEQIHRRDADARCYHPFLKSLGEPNNPGRQARRLDPILCRLPSTKCCDKKQDIFPVPRIDDSLDLLAGTRFFSWLDLASGYWQVGMDPASQEKTAFTTHAGLYVMPFGLCNAFQRLMEGVLAGLARDKCLIYLDDVLVMGRTFAEHLSNLRDVFSRLSAAGLRLKPTKCRLVRGEVLFLGYVVSASGISADPGKVRTVTEFPTPTDLRSLRAFLGLTSYYQRFVPHLSVIAQPLYHLTRKDTPFQWTPECDLAFTRLKSTLAELYWRT